jgi:hypothetical protein
MQPTGACRDEMKYKARVALQPVTHFAMLVGSRVVQDEMERNFAGKHFIQIAQKVEKLLMPIAVIAWANHLPRRASKQVNRVVVPLGLQSWAMVSITDLFEN